MEVVVADAVIMAMEQKGKSKCLRQISTSRRPTLGLTRRRWHQRRRMVKMRMALPLNPTRHRTRGRKRELIIQQNRFLILYHLQRRLLRHQHEVMVGGEVAEAEIAERRRGSATLLHLASLAV
jgi:hypothetical protein